MRFLSSLGRVQWLASSTRLSCMMLQHELLVCGTQVFEVLKFLAPRCFSCVLSCISLPLAAGSLLFFRLAPQLFYRAKSDATPFELPLDSASFTGLHLDSF